MHRPAHHRFTVAEYLALEQSSGARHEYVDGAILAMAGGTLAHDRVVGNVYAALHAALRGRPCEAHTADLRLVTPRGLWTYPDVSVFCGPIELSSTDPSDTATNPTLLVEVLSPSTRDYDAGEKLDAYRQIPSLREVLLVEVDAAKVVRHVRTAADWSTVAHQGLEGTVTLASIDASLALRDVYARVLQS